jgi:triosephosphate isomerase
MDRKKNFLIAGNWKMNLDLRRARDLAGQLAERFQEKGPVEVCVFPPAVYLMAVAEEIGTSAVGLGAQNVYWQGNGAYTGEISAAMLLDIGCRYVIVGHSERRTLMGETNQDVNVRTRAALDAGLVPVVCLGETLAEREAGRTEEVVSRQFRESLAEIEARDITRLVIAYEPVWAIGTGRVATGDQAQAVHADLRRMLASRYNPELADQVRILYGGSVKPDNAGDLLGRADIDGALVGGASLDAGSFSGIVDAALACA